MFRRILAALLCLCMLPLFALAESTPMFQVSTFAGRLPERLQEPLSAMISDETRIVSGAAIQHNGIFFKPDEPDSWNSYSAMLIVDTDEGPLLLAAAWVDGRPWQVDDFTRFLRREENVSVSIYQPAPNRIPVFSVDYTDRSGMVSDLMLFRGNRLWQLAGHINEAHGIDIAVDMCSATVIDEQGRLSYSCTLGFWMDYMTSIDELPTSRTQVQALESAAHAAYSANEVRGLSYTSGANLRQRPTSSSESLGLYYSSVPLTLTGEQSPGTVKPWYKVRIGNTEGWMSSTYVWALPAQYYPVPMGRTVDDCPMYAQPGDAQPIQQLEPGTTFHILTEYEGMYHICIPREEITWDVDRTGTYGYIPKEGLLEGASISALDALESAQ